jgi:superoxide reductase
VNEKILLLKNNICLKLKSIQGEKKMTDKLHVYKCEICGNMVEVIHAGKGQLVCCGQPMKLCQENVTDAVREKHVPVVEETNKGIKVKVGSVAHPMEANHYIEWIEVMTDGKADRQFLEPGNDPEAMFDVEPAKVTVRDYCNLHGLWKG